MANKNPFTSIVDRPAPTAGPLPAAPTVTPAQFWKLRSLLRDHHDLAQKADSAFAKAQAFISELGLPVGYQFGLNDDTETVTLLGRVDDAGNTSARKH